ncbi:hypothetical protein PG985_014729 [Apiospora marii]|uniref:uncharacterized protein n=1 Tax=Apiospora marii TaxID=335849 RepID=UPI003132168B
MSKARFIIACDGTACSEYLGNDKSPLTNVSRITRAIKSRDERSGQECRQIAVYLPGIGTDEGNLFNRSNQAIGQGLNSLILKGYTFLSDNWEEGDEIILIGYSRGAFAMRCLADFVIHRGIMPQQNLHTLPNNFKEWIEGGSDCGDVRPRSGIKIKVCALWDTVASMGSPLAPENQLGRFSFAHSDLLEDIEYAFQALSLHERRRHFRPIVWRYLNPVGNEYSKNLEQCWFAGYHNDVGGNGEKGVLAHFALAWLIAKLEPYVAISHETLWDGLLPINAWKRSRGDLVLS